MYREGGVNQKYGGTKRNFLTLRSDPTQMQSPILKALFTPNHFIKLNFFYKHLTKNFTSKTRDIDGHVTKEIIFDHTHKNYYI
jgi:hypothetical protein